MNPLALIGAFSLLGSSSKHQTRTPLAAAPYVAWLEADGDRGAKRIQNLIYPLAFLDTWKDASFDPGAESKAWGSVSKARLPLASDDELEVFHLGHPEGRIRITSISPVQAGFSALVLGRTIWTSDAPPQLTLGQGFTALWHGPAQQPWTTRLDETAQATLQRKLRTIAQKVLRLKNSPPIDSEEWGWCHTSFGEAAVGYVRFREGEHQRSWTSFVLVGKSHDPLVLWSSTGHDEGEFGAPIFQFLDAEDLDGDGIPEVIARYFGFEGTSFVIFRFDGKKVRQIYSGSHLGG